MINDLFTYTFFQHAFIGSLLASVLCGLIGTYIVCRRLVFISGGITHASFGGIGIGVYLGLPPILSAAIFSILSAFGIQWFSRQHDMREDSAIAIFWTLGMSIGIICSFLTPGFTPELSSYLFGNILTITRADLYFLSVLALAAVVTFLLFLRPILSVAFDREFALSQNIRVAWIEYVMMAFIALTIVACLRIIGIVLVISLLTIPQVTANIFTNDFKKIAALSVPIGFVGCIGGLLFAYHHNIPSGAAIIFTSITLYLASKGLSLLIRRKNTIKSTFSCYQTD